MKKTNWLFTAILALGFSQISLAQKSFSNCSAAFLNNKMVVSEYTDKGKCEISGSTSGNLTVNTVNLSSAESKAVDKITFKVAIRDKNTGTLTLFSDAEYTAVDIKSILSKCKKGDHIVLLTLNAEFSLPHNEILVN